jgi:hypothetical protein
MWSISQVNKPMNNSKMMVLALDYMEAVARVDALRNEMVQLLRDSDAQHIFDESGRQLALEGIQRDLYTVVLATQLKQWPEFAGVPPAKLMGEAEIILDKQRNPELLARVPSEMRTPDEERLYGALRVRWFELMKAAAIRRMPRGRRH